MNILHSSKTDSWQTPEYIVKSVQDVLGVIDLDPASSEEANQVIRAKRIITKEENGLAQDWMGLSMAPITVFINPPGGKILNKSAACLFWDKLMSYADQGLIRHAIFLAFSIEALQSTQVNSRLAMLYHPFCIPRTRIKFVDPSYQKRVNPTHAQAIVYVPGTENVTKLFVKVFSKYGICIQS